MFVERDRDRALSLRDVHGNDLFRQAPAASAAAARCWLRYANLVLVRPRDAPLLGHRLRCFPHRIGAVRLCIFGLMNRQPSVVSSSFRPRAKAASALAMTYGARDMLSTPPAMTSAISPLPIARAACTTASRLDPHNRLTVDPGTSWEPGEQQRHATDVAVVFTGLIGTPVNHIVDASAVEAGISLEERGDGDRGQVVGTHGGERAPIPAKRGPHRVADVDGMHVRVQTISTGDRGSGVQGTGAPAGAREGASDFRLLALGFDKIFEQVVEVPASLPVVKATSLSRHS